MPKGIPTILSGVIGRQNSARDDLSHAPEAEVLGVVDSRLTTLGPASQQETAAHDDVAVTDPPPPWELEAEATAADARKFVEVPAQWTLRWINPRLLDSQGWRYWQPVLASDPRVTVRVGALVMPDGNIRRGGQTGDILAWMLTSWVESRRRQHQAATARLTESAVARQQQLEDEFRRGTYGPYLHLDRATHPTHTMAEGKSMRDA